MDYFIFIALLKYLYTDHLISVSYHVPKLKLLAERFSLPRLVALCCRHMGLIVKQENGKVGTIIPPSSWREDLQQMVNFPLYSDLSLVLEDSRIIHVHKVLLAARMSYFKTIFEGSFKEGHENTMVLKEVEYEPLLMVLSFVYTNAISFPEEKENYVLEVLLCAGRFLVEELKQNIEKMLEEQLNKFCEEGDHVEPEDLESVLNFLFISETVETPKLKNACLDFISEGISRFRALEGWKEVMSRYPETLNRIEELERCKLSRREKNASEGI
eukprot:TRINITY_DN6672_c0_g1_i2.p1 TRINITY_DN6672_c0_g1~~TRINITY_DN6672_c0_g1_i2.p1  ORF type:complete len:271 (-),score=62.72 TRINITY_DN6672_c0_g1_i2:130-942(-)